MKIRQGAVFAFLLATSAPAFSASARLLPDRRPARELAWRGQQSWRLMLDEEKGLLRLGFIETPAGDYLVTGSLQLDDAELGVTGSGRWRGDRLILDLTISGGVRDVPPDAGKQRLYPQGQAPAAISATGLAMLRAELDRATLNGPTSQYQTNIVTGDHVQGPVLRLGRLEHLSS